MRENYNFEYWKNDRRRLQFSVIRGTSYRYLWHEEVELMLPLSGELEYFAGERHYHLKIEVFPHQQLTSMIQLNYLNVSRRINFHMQGG